MVKLMDCTLRDGGNVVGKGFNAEITDLVLDGLTSAGVPIVELGNAGGIGAYEVAGFTKAETDETYLKIAQKYMGRGTELGMFLNAKRYHQRRRRSDRRHPGLPAGRPGDGAVEEAVERPLRHVRHDHGHCANPAGQEPVPSDPVPAGGWGDRRGFAA